MDLGRRAFLASGLASGAAQAGTALPMVRFGKAEVSRLIIGTNPFCGYSHFNSILDAAMREWYTDDRKLEVLRRCEQAGIRTWQLHTQDITLRVLERYKQEGGKMNTFLLSDFELQKEPRKYVPWAAALGPIGIAHHGNRTDERFRSGEMEQVKDFCKLVRDCGVMVGVSTHNPRVIDYIEERDWDVDYYMTCFYRVSRTKEESRAEFGEAGLGESFMEKDPERMTERIRRTRKPCLGFKILGAGRAGGRKEQIEAAFRYAYASIKPGDALIVGMFPKFKDEVTENAALARQYGGLRS